MTALSNRLRFADTRVKIVLSRFEDIMTYYFEDTCVDIVWKLLVHQGGSPAGIHGLFSGWYYGLASRKVTLGVSMAWAKGGHPQKEDQGYVDSGCSRHMTGNMSYLSDFKEFDGGYVTFGGGAKGGKITSKGTLKTGKLDFEDVYFVKEL
ncbi:hypothetical protein Tco_0145956 [Tanacetum coccineum]